MWRTSDIIFEGGRAKPWAATSLYIAWEEGWCNHLPAWHTGINGVCPQITICWTACGGWRATTELQLICGEARLLAVCCRDMTMTWRCHLNFASSRHGHRPSFSLNKFFIFTINLNCYSNPQVFIKTRYMTFPKSDMLIWPKLAMRVKLTLPVFFFLAWVAILTPSPNQLIILILPCSH